MAAPPLAGRSISARPRLGAVLEVPQGLLVIVIKHLHIAVGLTQLLEKRQGRGGGGEGGGGREGGVCGSQL